MYFVNTLILMYRRTDMDRQHFGWPRCNVTGKPTMSWLYGITIISNLHICIFIYIIICNMIIIYNYIYNYYIHNLLYIYIYIKLYVYISYIYYLITSYPVTFFLLAFMSFISFQKHVFWCVAGNHSDLKKNISSPWGL